MEPFLHELFQPQHTQVALQRLRLYGGVHSLAQDLQQHREVGWVSSQGSWGQHLLEWVLLYVVSLSLLAKCFLFTQGQLQHFTITSEVTGILLLVIILLLKQKSTIHQPAPTEDRAPPFEAWTVSRGDREMKVGTDCIRPGDFLLVGPAHPVPADGILVNPLPGSAHSSSEAFSRIVVSESEFRSSEVQMVKHCIESGASSEEHDPFIRRGSSIVSGTAWMLVCRVEPQLQQKQSGSDLETGVSQLAQVHTFVAFTKCFMVLPVFTFGFEWLSGPGKSQYEGFIEFVSAVGSLLLYLAYLHQNLALEALNRYFLEQQETPAFSAMQAQSLEGFGGHDILTLQEWGRGSLEALSLLNQYHDVKIVTERSHGQIEKDFAQELNHLAICSEEETLPLHQKVPVLLAAKFLPTNSGDIRSHLTLLEQMGFSVLLFSADQLQPVVAQLRGGRREERVRIKREERARTKGEEGLAECLLELEVSSLRLRKLKDCYLAIVMNECLEFAILVGCTCCRLTLDLNLGLFVLYASRSSLGNLLKKWTTVDQGWGLARENKWTLNLTLAAYYLFLLRGLLRSQHKQFLLFLLLVANRLFRTEALSPSLDRWQFGGKVGCLWVVVLGYWAAVWLERREGFEWEWGGALLAPLVAWLYFRFHARLQ